MTEPDMQLLFEFQCYDCGVDRYAAAAHGNIQQCVDKFNCEIFYALSSKSFDMTKSTFIVMLKKWMCDYFSFDKSASKHKDIAGSIITTPTITAAAPTTQTTASITTPQTNYNNQQVQPPRCPFQSDINLFYANVTVTHLNNIQMGQNSDFPPTVFYNKNYCGNGFQRGISSNKNNNNCAPYTDHHHQTIDCCNQCFRKPMKNGPRSSDLWSDCENKALLRESNDHSKLPCNEQQNYNMNTNRDDLSSAIGTDVEQQQQNVPCTLSSTKLVAGENWTRISTATTETVLTVPRRNINVNGNEVNANKSNDWNMMSAPSKRASLKLQHRSPSVLLSSTSIVHRANLLNIFIKYLLILNCFVYAASGNLMSRNVGNDLSKHNQTSIETATTQLNGSASTLIDANGGGGRKGMPTTPSPLILHSIMSNNRSQFMASALNQRNGRTNSNNHHHLHHQQPSTAAQDLNYDNYGDSGSEEFKRCASCQFREQLKQQNLDSIKMHILARLSMTRPPNITGRPHISEQILQSFYQSNDFRYIRIRNGSNGGMGGNNDDYGSVQNEDDDDDMNEMQGDDPSVTNNKHQHHHIYNRNGGIKSGLHEQHHHHQPPQYYQSGTHSRY